MNREYEASAVTMGAGWENMMSGFAALFSMAIPFLRANVEPSGRAERNRLEERRGERARMAGTEVRLEEALCGLREEVESDCALQFRVFVSGKHQNLNPGLYKQVYSVSREAVENAFRHSAATIVEAEVVYAGNTLQVLIRDNGCGIGEQDLEEVGTGRGLLAMRDRTESLGGQFRMWSKEGAGTEIEVCVPLNGPIAN